MPEVLGKLGGIAVALLVLGVVVLLHETGHFVLARLGRMAVLRFSIGFGPPLLSWRRRETQWCLSAVPFLGGYVMVDGMADETELVAQDAGWLAEGRARARRRGLVRFDEAPRPWRAAVLAGGVAFQLLFCLVILSGLVLLRGKPLERVVVVGVEAASPAEKAGLAPGDCVLLAAGQPVRSVGDLQEAVAGSAGRELALVVERRGERVALSLVPEPLEGAGRGRAGVALTTIVSFTREGARPSDYLLGGARLTWRLVRQAAGVLGGLLSGPSALRGVMGPVGIIDATRRAASLGFWPLFNFFVLINVGIAFFNLLPLPALDGGHLLLLGVEAATRRTIPNAVRRRITLVGFVLLGLLLLLVTVGDVSRLLGRG